MLHVDGLLASFGWDARVADGFAQLELDDAPRTAGRVARVDRSACLVATGERDVVASADTLPAVGDWVAIEEAGDDAVIAGVIDRWSELARRDPDTGQVKVLAVNVDLVLMTVPGDRPNPARVERESVLAWESGARPVAVVTKGDVAAPGLRADLARRLHDVDIIVTSSVTGDGLDAIVALLAPSRTAVLIGPSGAGKSTLVNAILGENRFATGAVRGSDGRGRHTTTSRELVVVPTGGVLVDTPGLRSLGLFGDDGIALAFAEIEELARSCRFGDCAHDQEPGCAVVAAVAAGTLPAERLGSYRRLTRELDDAAAKDELDRRAKRR
ncbi:MAG TPA: ribosome small subunit-dependent GTPase A [Acidimicrobiia bacterium]|nr:ribosome small subunit-dependent GTPase A [Acidimicrobiia bacterium]